MILVRLMGGLGNQMFQYAFGKSLALRYNVDLKLDLSLLGKEYLNSDSVVRDFDLDVFNLPSLNFATQEEVIKFNGKLEPSFIDRFVFKLRRMSGKYPILVQRNQECDLQKVFSMGNNVCVVGKWQSELFFKDHANEIKKLFSFKNFTPNSYSANVAKDMRNHVSVGVQVRRGDYVSHPVYSKGLGALDSVYYFEAMELLKSKLPSSDLKFYFISDDIAWCKQHFASINNCTFIEQERSKIGYLSDLWLLQLCDHSVISNSTLAWWGAWLGEKQNSAIIAPKNWARQREFVPQSVIPERWIVLNNKFEEISG